MDAFIGSLKWWNVLILIFGITMSVISILWFSKGRKIVASRDSGITIEDGERVERPATVHSHVDCPYYKDIIILIDKVTWVVSERERLRFRQRLLEQMNYAEQRYLEMKGKAETTIFKVLARVVDGPLLKETTDDRKEYLTMVTKNVFQEVRDYTRVAFRENHYTEMKDETFLEYRKNKSVYMLQRIKDVFTNYYGPDFLFHLGSVSKESADDFSRLEEYVLETVQEIFEIARKVSRDIEEQCADLDTEFEIYMKKLLS